MSRDSAPKAFLAGLEIAIRAEAEKAARSSPAPAGVAPKGGSRQPCKASTPRSARDPQAASGAVFWLPDGFYQGGDS